MGTEGIEYAKKESTDKEQTVPKTSRLFNKKARRFCIWQLSEGMKH